MTIQRNMKLTEDIILTKHHYAPAGAPINRYSISDKPINALIDNLCEKGIEVNSDYSEKEVKYFMRTGKSSSEERVVTVPLLTNFPNEVTPMTFYLKDGGGLELELCKKDITYAWC